VWEEKKNVKKGGELSRISGTGRTVFFNQHHTQSYTRYIHTHTCVFFAGRGVYPLLISFFFFLLFSIFKKLSFSALFYFFRYTSDAAAFMQIFSIYVWRSSKGVDLKWPKEFAPFIG
jgi:hypothetical protein